MTNLNETVTAIRKVVSIASSDLPTAKALIYSLYQNAHAQLSREDLSELEGYLEDVMFEISPPNGVL